MTTRQLLLLCVLAYRDPPKAMRARIAICLTVGRLARAQRALAEQGACPARQGSGQTCCDLPDETERAFLLEIERDETLSSLKVIAFTNQNDGDGFVAYAFAGERGVVCAFRGSESTFACAPNDIDWLDNFRAPFLGSVQYASVARFVAPYSNGELLLTGHSKGAHNALYALAVSQNARAGCRCFDGQGFSSDQLTRAQRAALHWRGVNYVQRHDLVGSLLCHPETRVFVQNKGEGNPHSLASLAFAPDGEPIPVSRSFRSRVIGFLSCAIAIISE